MKRIRSTWFPKRGEFVLSQHIHPTVKKTPAFRVDWVSVKPGMKDESYLEIRGGYDKVRSKFHYGSIWVWKEVRL